MSKTNDRSARSMLAVAVSLFLICAQISGAAAQSQSRAAEKKGALTGDQRVAHVLSRLTFGARPGDFHRLYNACCPAAPLKHAPEIAAGVDRERPSSATKSTRDVNADDVEKGNHADSN